MFYARLTTGLLPGSSVNQVGLLNSARLNYLYLAKSVETDLFNVLI